MQRDVRLTTQRWQCGLFTSTPHVLWCILSNVNECVCMALATCWHGAHAFAVECTHLH